MMVGPAIWTSPTCKFATKRAGLHKPILRGNEKSGYVCANCQIAMQASYNELFSGGVPFCHDCGATAGPGDLFSYVFRDVEAMILCEPCNSAHIAKIAGEQAALASTKEALVIHSTDARTAIAEAQTANEKQSLYQRFKEKYGLLRRIK